MKVLIGCEFSGIVREAFRKRGHEAYSCDILPSSDNSKYHIQDDVLNILNDNWDLAIFHPPCTYLCSSGIHWNDRGRGWDETNKALEFVNKLLNAPIEKIALENPVGIISSRIRKPDQIIQPWQFGHDASKATCLWLKNLSKLQHAKIIAPKKWKLIKFASDMPINPDTEEAFCEECDMDFAECECFGPTQDDVEYKEFKGYLFGTMQKPIPKMIWGNQTPSGQNKLGPSEDRWMERSLTYQGIADEMVKQWG